MNDDPFNMEIEALSERSLRENPHVKPLLNILDTMDAESDRGRVLVSCNLIDETLKNILCNFMVECKQASNLIDGFNAPFGTFASRNTACFALGLISLNEFNEIDTLRKIRNKFAHETNITIDDMSVKDLASNLKFCKTGFDDKVRTPMEKFIPSAYAIILYVGQRMHSPHAEQRRKQRENADLSGA